MSSYVGTATHGAQKSEDIRTYETFRFSMVVFPTMKPLDSDKKVSKEASAPAEAAQAAPVVEEKIDFSNVQIEPLFQDQVDFDTFSKSDFRAVKVKECEAGLHLYYVLTWGRRNTSRWLRVRYPAGALSRFLRSIQQYLFLYETRKPLP